jgi:CSLREA domain-containing protein
MSSSPLVFTSARALAIGLISITLVAIASVSASRQYAGAPSRATSRDYSSTSVTVTDKGNATPAGSTIQVNSNADVSNAIDGLCTLREAITAANNNFASGAVAGECMAGSSIGSDAISFSIGGTINLTGALPDIVSDLTLTGPGSASLTVRRDTGGDYRIFLINNRNVTISGMTIINGRTPDGASSTTTNGQTATSGGGIYAAGGTVTFNDLVVTNNQTGNGGDSTAGSTFQGGWGGQGGGIWASGTVNMTNCVVSNNRTGHGGTGGYGGGGGYAGGIIVGPGAATLTNVTVSDNITGDGGVGISGGLSGSNSGYGGGIYSIEIGVRPAICDSPNRQFEPILGNQHPHRLQLSSQIRAKPLPAT